MKALLDGVLVFRLYLLIISLGPKSLTKMPVPDRFNLDEENVIKG